MTGSRRQGLVIQNRDRQLLRELGTMRVIDREQAKVVAGFGSTTRANTRLLALSRAGLLRRVFVGTVASGLTAVYSLSPQGAILVDAKLPSLSLKPRGSLKGTLSLDHQLQINSIYLTVKHRPIPVSGLTLRRWVIFHEPLSKASALIPDGYFELESAGVIHPMFLEVDLSTEVSKVWRQKTQRYLQLATSGEFQKLFSQSKFRVLVITTTERRVETIRAAVSRFTEKIFWFSTFEVMDREGFWSPIWLRPKGDPKHLLL